MFRARVYNNISIAPIRLSEYMKIILIVSISCVFFRVQSYFPEIRVCRRCTSVRSVRRKRTNRCFFFFFFWENMTRRRVRIKLGHDRIGMPHDTDRTSVTATMPENKVPETYVPYVQSNRSRLRALNKIVFL